MSAFYHTILSPVCGIECCVNTKEKREENVIFKNLSAQSLHSLYRGAFSNILKISLVIVSWLLVITFGGNRGKQT